MHSRSPQYCSQAIRVSAVTRSEFCGGQRVYCRHRRLSCRWTMQKWFRSMSATSSARECPTSSLSCNNSICQMMLFSLVRSGTDVRETARRWQPPLPSGVQWWMMKGWDWHQCCVFRPHHSTTVTDTVVWSVGLSVMIMSPAKTAELIEMLLGMWTEVGPRKHIRWRWTVAPPGKYDWRVHVWRWCGLLSSYFDHFFSELSHCRS